MVKKTTFQHGWVVKTIKNGVAKYETISDETVDISEGWRIFEKEVEIPDTAGAESVKLYMKGSPADAEFILDDVSLVDTTELCSIQKIVPQVGHTYIISYQVIVPWVGLHHKHIIYMVPFN